MLPALLLLAALNGQDPVRVQAVLNQEEIRAGETTVLRVNVETEGARARIDRFRALPPGLELEGTRDFDQRQFSIPGGTRRFVSREFVIRARAPGRYRIPSVDVVVGGQTYTTSSTLLTVTAAPARPRGETPGDRGDGVILRAWLDSDTVFVGEQVTMQAEAMFGQEARLRLRRAPEYEPPSPSGFWIHDIPDPRRPSTRTVGGQIYEVQRFRRVFFPLSPGDYEIPPARLEYEMRRGLLYAPETLEITSEPLPLVVLPVPTTQPPEFTGAVGSYTMRGWLEPARVPAGEAAVLTIEVEGEGNVKALPPPSLPELDGIDAFPPSEEADTEVQGSVVRGTKRFSWVLIPRQAGDLEIPQVRYAYFDPDAGAFETVAAGPMTLSVTPGSGTDDIPSAPTLRYLKTAPGAADPLSWVRSSWFAALQALPLVLLALALGWRRGRTRGGVTSARALRRRRKQRVRELEVQAGRESDADLFARAESFAREWLAERLSLRPSAAGDTASLEAAGVPADTASAVRGLLDRLAAARYAPTLPAAEARRDIVRALGRVLERVDAEAPRPAARRRPDPGAAHALLALGVIGSLATSAPPAAAQVPTPVEPDGVEAAPAELTTASAVFEAGIRAYDEERYLVAADAFDRYVGLRSSDPAGWYNLGTAYHRAGYPGYAVWAWLKVPELDPRDRDARHNLRITGVPPELVARVAPPLPLRASELFLLAAAAWLVSAAAGGLWLLRRGPRAGITGGVALLAAITLAGAGMASTHHPETLIVLETATLRAGPTLRAEPVAELDPGTGLTPIGERGAWTRARTLRGDEGWIESTTTAEL